MDESFRLLFALGVVVHLPASAQESIDFNRDIRPLLSDRGFHCHGFAAQRQQRY